MRMQADPQSGGPIVRGLVGSGFRLDEERVVAAVLMTHEAATEWSPPPIASLDMASLAILVDAQPEFILIGTGATLVRPPVTLVNALEAQGIGVEAMDSRAAARAWGVLRGEGRVIGAALYPLDA